MNSNSTLNEMNIPIEIREGATWAVSTMEVLDPLTGRTDKSPRNPITGKRISVTSAEGWTDFTTALSAGYPAIGIRLTKEDPWVVIDIDEIKTEDEDKKADQLRISKKICKAFKLSYQEESFSGKGVHIFLKGDPCEGRREDNVEIYSQERYIICTGKYLQKNPKEVLSGGSILVKVRERLFPCENSEAISWIDSGDEVRSDNKIKREMFLASNGDKVRSLYTNPPKVDEDWSVLDAQLAQHIAFYTDNHEQALRLFRESSLYRGQGEKLGYERVEKYEGDYLLKRTFMRAWTLNNKDKEEKNRKVEGLLESLRANRKKGLEDSSHSVETLPPIANPGGLVGEIADYVVKRAHKSFWEAGISAGLALVSAISGRHYNIEHQGLGLYIILLAGTGRGKESASAGVSALISKVAESTEDILLFQGPGSFGSGQGFLKFLADEMGEDGIPSQLCTLGEFGHSLRVITAENANAADIRTRQALLELFSKCYWGGTINKSAHADKSNTVGRLVSPNVTLLADTTPETFFKSVTAASIAEGLTPRFMVIEYAGERGRSNYNKVINPPKDLIDRLTSLVHSVISSKDNNVCANIEVEDEALIMLRDFEEQCDERINSGSGVVEMWNRVYQKVLRVAGTVAVGRNSSNPIVTCEIAEWAMDLGRRDIKSIESRFIGGGVGGKDMEMEYALREQLNRYFGDDCSSAKKRVSEDLKDKGVIPYSYLMRTAGRSSLFTESSRGRDVSIARTVTNLISLGDIIEVNVTYLKNQSDQEGIKSLKTDQRLFVMGDNYLENWSLQNKI
jgi:hypothetical protein